MSLVGFVIPLNNRVRGPTGLRPVRGPYRVGPEDNRDTNRVGMGTDTQTKQEIDQRVYQGSTDGRRRPCSP